VKERLKHLPQQPGVYIFKDKEGQVIYVGKAIILRNRVRSYFQSPERLHPKVRAMMNRVADLDYVVTSSEVEALILENNLIKEHRPRYNIDLKDDKSYPYVKITLGDKYPRVYITREKMDGVSRYFGPYTDVGSLRESLKVLSSIFPLRRCRVFRTGSRPCLNRDMKKCLAPCTGLVPVEEYRAMVDGVTKFLEGDIKSLLGRLEQEMKEAAARLDFEQAARLRDSIASIIKIQEKQQIALFKSRDQLLEAQRIEQRTRYDLEMIREIGYCKGIENYSRYITDRKAGEPPYTLIDFFPSDYLLFMDESHIGVPQVRGMYEGDRARKQNLVNFGFRLPSALDNRPLKFEEFNQKIKQVIFVSATPGPYEMERSSQVVEQIIRPTGLVDPQIVVKPTLNQIDDLMENIQQKVSRGFRVLVTTLTKRMAEDLCDYLADAKIKVRYLHSDIDALERLDILRELLSQYY
jgi:hypothetical protein